MASAGFSASLLHERLARFPRPGPYLVGFSGGGDSTALLDALHELADERSFSLAAIHFHHGLNPDADRWQEHCERFCRQRGIPLRTERLQLNIRPGASPELAARKARYRWLESTLQPDHIFLTAHHRDDRAETLLLNLLRGSGLDGIASIPELRRLGKGWVARPLLEVARHDLESYLLERGLTWVEDSSNRDSTPDRNYLRNELFPLLESRWPGVVERLGRTARHARATVDTLTHDLEARFGHARLDEFTFASSTLTDLPRVFQVLLIRHWVRERGVVPPPERRLDEFLNQLAQTAPEDSAVELCWDGWMLRRDRQRLWLHPERFPNRCPSLTWSGSGTLNLGTGFGTLSAPVDNSRPHNLIVGPRKPCRGMVLHQNGPHRSLKDLMRETGIPPWLRDAVPVLYDDDEVLAIGDWMLSARFLERLPADSGSYRWSPSDGLLRKLQSDCQAHTIDRPIAVS